MPLPQADKPNLEGAAVIPEGIVSSGSSMARLMHGVCLCHLGVDQGRQGAENYRICNREVLGRRESRRNVLQAFSSLDQLTDS